MPPPKIFAGRRANLVDEDGHLQRMLEYYRKKERTKADQTTSSLGTLVFSSCDSSQRTEILIAEERKRMDAIQQQLRRQDSASSNDETYELTAETRSRISRRSARSSSRAGSLKDGNKDAEPKLSASETSTQNEASRPSVNEAARPKSKLEKESTAVEFEQSGLVTNVEAANVSFEHRSTAGKERQFSSVRTSVDKHGDDRKTNVSDSSSTSKNERRLSSRLSTQRPTVSPEGSDTSAVGSILVHPIKEKEEQLSSAEGARLEEYDDEKMRRRSLRSDTRTLEKNLTASRAEPKTTEPKSSSGKPVRHSEKADQVEPLSVDNGSAQNSGEVLTEPLPRTRNRSGANNDAFEERASESDRSRKSRENSAASRSRECLKSTGLTGTSDSLQLTKIIRENMAGSTTVVSSDIADDSSTISHRGSAAAEEKTRSSGQVTVVYKLQSIETTPEIRRPETSPLMPLPLAPTVGIAAAVKSNVCARPSKSAANRKTQSPDPLSCETPVRHLASQPRKATSRRTSRPTGNIGCATSTPITRALPDLDTSISTIVAAPTKAEETGKRATLSKLPAPSPGDPGKRRQQPLRGCRTARRESNDGSPLDAATVDLRKRKLDTPFPKSEAERQKQKWPAGKKAKRRADYELDCVSEATEINSAVNGTVHSSPSSLEETSAIFEREKTAKRRLSPTKSAPKKESSRPPRLAKKREPITRMETRKSSLETKKGKKTGRTGRGGSPEDSSLTVGRESLPRAKRTERRTKHSVSSSDGDTSNGWTTETPTVKRQRPNVHSRRGHAREHGKTSSSWPCEEISPSLTEGCVPAPSYCSTFTYTPTAVGRQVSDDLSDWNISSVEASAVENVGTSFSTAKSAKLVSKRQSRKSPQPSLGDAQGRETKSGRVSKKPREACRPPSETYNVDEGEGEAERTELPFSEGRATPVTGRTKAGGRRVSEIRRQTIAQVSFAEEATYISASTLEQSSTSALATTFNSTLSPPHISWGQTREKTPGRRRSSRTRVRRLRPHLGEEIVYERVGGLAQIVGVVPGHVDVPLLKRNKVHSMSQYVEKICEQRKGRGNKGGQRDPLAKELKFDESAVVEANSEAFDQPRLRGSDGEALTERRIFRFDETQRREIGNGVVKYEYEENSLSRATQFAVPGRRQFDLKVEVNETLHVLYGALLIVLNGTNIALLTGDRLILRPGDGVTAKNCRHEAARILIDAHP